MTSALEALTSLREGNARYVAGATTVAARSRPTKREALVAGQSPFAVVLGCADSRVPVEVVFDQGLGELFVVRTAGNIAAPSQIGSIEFAVEQLGTRLVVVLGHTGCGAVEATLGAIETPDAEVSPSLAAIVSRVRPAVEPLLESALRADRPALLEQAVRDNVRAAAHEVRHVSPVIARLAEQDGLRVVGAEYDLATGVIEFFDGVDEVG